MNQFYQEKYPEFKMLIEYIKELISKRALPADEDVMDDEAVQKFLNISKRKLAQLRADRKIKYYYSDDEPANKKSGVNEGIGNLKKGNRRSKIYYVLIDVVAYAKRNPVPAIADNIKLKGSGM
jgi:hypothetical protein